MKKNGKNIGSLLLVGLLFLLVLAIAVAVEVGILLLVGMEYTHWKNIGWFIITYGLVELLIVTLVDYFIDTKVKHNAGFHKWFAHFIIGFVIVMCVAISMESIYIPTHGAVLFAVLSASIYAALNRGKVKISK